MDVPSALYGTPWSAGVLPASPHVGLVSAGVPLLKDLPPALLEWVFDFLRLAGVLPGDLVEQAAASYAFSLTPSTLG